MRVPKGYSRNAPCTLNLIQFFFIITITTSSGELLVPAGIIRPVVHVPSSSSSSSLVTENHQRTDVYFPAHAW